MVKFKSNKKMKILYILLAVIFFPCKTENDMTQEEKDYQKIIADKYWD